MLIYQKNGQYFAQAATGTEELGAQELRELGASEVRSAFRGIYFHGDRECLYRVNYQSRFLSRILAPLAVFDCPDPDILYRKAKSVSWPDIFGTDKTFAVSANVSHSRIAHSQYAALRVKDAVADQFRKQHGKRPNVDTDSPDVRIDLYLHKDKATISLDTSGGSLHRRGYRKEGMEAPMQETVASAIIRMSGWDGSCSLHDPMCGAGTLLIEALMQCCRIPAGFLRPRFGFEFLPDFDPAIWQSVRKTADQQIQPLPNGLISGSDILPRAVSAAERNSLHLPYGESIRFSTRAFQEIPGLENSVIVCNPPYGIRMGTREDSGAMMKEFGDFLKQRCKGSSAYVYFGDRDLMKRIGLKPSWKKELRNGGLDGRLAKYEMY
ncbi:MAG: THUMP domain-containing protein [Desulfobacterales bacterium]